MSESKSWSLWVSSLAHPENGGLGFILPAPPPSVSWVSRALFSQGLPGQGSVSAGRSSPAWQLPRPPSGSSKAMVVMEMSEKQQVLT